MLTRTELERSGPWSLVRQQFVGVSGQVCSTTYELVGPEPGHYRDLAEARAAFGLASKPAISEAACAISNRSAG